MGKIVLYFMVPLILPTLEILHTLVFALFCFIVVKIQRQIYSLNKILRVKYSVVDYRYNIVQQIKTHLSCKAET